MEGEGGKHERDGGLGTEGGMKRWKDGEREEGKTRRIHS